MVSLDRVGVGQHVPISFYPGTPMDTAEDLAAAARGLQGVAVTVGTNTTSDHESFAVAGLPAARLGSTDYDEYHSSEGPAPGRRSGAAGPGRPPAHGLAARELNSRKPASIRCASRAGTTRGAWSAPIR